MLVENIKLERNLRNMLYLFDTETTSLDPVTGSIVELAIMSVREHDLRPMMVRQFHADSLNVEDTRFIHGLSSKCVSGHKFDWSWLPPSGSILVAHNIKHDWSFVKEHAKRDGIVLPDVELLDTMLHLDLSIVKGRALLHILGELGIPTLPAHCALMDVIMLQRLLCWALPDMPNILRRMRSDVVVYVPEVQRFEDNDKYKANGFRWNSENKKWEIRLIDGDVLPVLPFRVVRYKIEECLTKRMKQ